MSDSSPAPAPRKILCQNFKAGSKPTGDQFAQLIHSLVHHSDDGLTFSEVKDNFGSMAHMAMAVKGRLSIELPGTLESHLHSALNVNGRSTLKGHVGIRTVASPDMALKVEGDVQIDGKTSLQGPVGIGQAPNPHYALTIRAQHHEMVFNQGGRNPDAGFKPRSRWLSLANDQGAGKWHIDYLGGGLNIGEGDQFQLDLTRLFIARGGDVGIGTITPKSKLHVIGGMLVEGEAKDMIEEFRLLDMYGGLSRRQEGTQVADVSITATNAVHAQCFRAISDARLKTDQSKSDSAQDLSILLRIEITDYVHKDVIEKGAGPNKKVIAQQVEQVFPQAVSTNKGIAPDIYANAPLEIGGWVRLTTNLTVGERVRLIGQEEQGIYEVLEVTAGAFRTACTDTGSSVFVYGREVEDLRSVDYDALSMLNISATQELHRKCQQQAAALYARDRHIADLEQRLAELEKRDLVRETRLACIEALLTSPPAPRMQDGFTPGLIPAGATLLP